MFRDIYSRFGDLRDTYGPVGAPRGGDRAALLNPNIYDGGSLVLYALEQEVGASTFAAIERAWVSTERNRSASTADFGALASTGAGRDLTSFLDGWLYGGTTPPMPGHPDWPTTPASAGR